ncbi:MAG: carboxypeptidase regulatory-like domain-containing protein [Phycisphaeraceae bacterium]|nr:carboxypeptidase regulatory-like domain-containing protein [Phycisphaeraceae bacterium]
MSQAKDRELLRRLEMIARVKPSPESTARAMDHARQALLDAAQVPATEPESASKTHYIKWRPLTQVAVAAMVMAAISIGIVVWKGSFNQPSDRGVARRTNPITIDQRLANLERLKLEAGQIQKLAALADTVGLLNMLETAQPANQQIIAKYLGDLAGPEAVPALSRLAVKWTGPAMANPFILATSQIQTRLASAIASEPIKQDPISVAPKTGPSLLNGRVTDLGTGDPIAGAAVSVSGSGTFETRTNAQGVYSFNTLNPEGYYRVQVTAPGYLGLTSFKEMPRVSLSESKAMTQDVQLRKGCLVTVHVVDQTGQPVKDVSVTASWLGSDHDNVVGHQGITDTDGQSLVGAVETSEIEYMVTAMHPDFAPQRASIKCSDPLIDHSLEITLTPGQNVPAYAEYSDHVAAEGVMIIARPEWWHSTLEPPSQTVGSDGRFTLTSVASQTYRLFARFSQENGSSYELEVAQKTLPLADGDLLLLTLPQASPPVTESVIGTIRWVDNLKPESLDILAYTATQPDEGPAATQYSQTTLNDNLDAFEIKDLVPGLYNLSFRGTNVRPVLVPDVSTSDDSLIVTLEYVPTPTLKGAILRADTGAPIKNFTLALRKQLDLPNLLVYADKRLYRPMADNEAGQFDIELPGTGTYQALIQSPGYVPVTKMLEITGDDRELVLNMRQGGTIMGRVQDIHGQDITGASVTVTSQTSDSSAIKVVTENGQFSVSTIPEGLAKLRISHPDHGSLDIEDLDVVQGITLDLSLITLNIGATIQGYVLDNAGLPVPRAMLIVEDGSQDTSRASRLATVTTDDTGYYQISGLPSDLCYVTRRDPATHTGVVRRSLIGEKETTYELDFGVGPQVTGRLAEATGELVANTRLLLSHPTNPASLLFQSYTQTDGAGLFTFAGIPAGHYGIYRQLPGTTAWTQVTTFDMLHDDMDLGLIPPKTAKIRVSLISGSNVVTTGWRILLQQGQSLWLQSPFLKQVDQPEEGDSRYLLDQVLPGDYCVIAQRNDSSQSVRLPVTMLPDGTDQDLIIELPAGHIAMSGRIDNVSNEALILFNQDKTLVMPIQEQDGRYRLSGIPAGDYVISNAFLGDMAPLEAFTLTADTKALELSIDTQQWISTGQGLIGVQVAGQDGLPLMSAEAWLTNETGTLTPLLRTDSELIFIAPIGPYTLTVSHDGFETQSENVTIESNAQIALYPERSVISVRLNTKRNPLKMP